jgi:hypothetical protein
MNWFRLYFLNETGRIAAREEFQAEDDQRAITITSLLFDACSDRSPDKRDVTRYRPRSRQWRRMPRCES